MSDEMKTEGTVESETNQNGIEAESFAQMSDDAMAKRLELAAEMFKSGHKNIKFLTETMRALDTKVFSTGLDEPLQNVPFDPTMFEEGGFKDEEEEDTRSTGQLQAPHAARFPAVDSVQKQSLFDPDSISNDMIEDNIVQHGKGLKKVTAVPQSASSTKRNLRLWVDFVRKILQKWKEDGNHNTSQDRLLPTIQQVVTYLEETEQQEPNLFKFEYWWRFAWVLENQDKFSSDPEICLVLILCSVTAGRETKAAKVAGEQGKYSKKRKQPGSDVNPTSGAT